MPSITSPERNGIPKYWLISDRNSGSGGIGTGSGLNNNGLTYFVSDGGPLNNVANWRKVSPGSFQTLLAAAADAFPEFPPAEHEDQSHVTILIHGYSNSFEDATKLYENLCRRLFSARRYVGWVNAEGICRLRWPAIQ